MADEKKEQPSVDSLNKGVLEAVNKDFTKWNDEFAVSVEAAKKNNAHISPQIFDDMLAARKAFLPELIEKVAKAREVQGNGAQYEKDWINNQTYKAQQEFEAKVKQRIMDGNKDGMKPDLFNNQVEEAYKLTEKGLPKKGILGSIVGSVYNEKDGIQWGGIGGAVLGLFLGSSLFGGMEGGLMGIVAMIALAVAGAFAGNMVSEKFFPAKTPEKTTDLTQGKGLTQEQAVGKSKGVVAGATIPAAVEATTVEEGAPAKPKAEERNDNLVFLGLNGSPMEKQTFFVDKDGKMLFKSDASSGLIKVTVDSKGAVTSFDVADEKGVFKFKDQDIPISLPDGKGVFKVESKTNEGVSGSYIDLNTSHSRSQLDSLRDAWNKKIEEFDKALLKGAADEKGSEQGAGKLSFNHIGLLNKPLTPDVSSVESDIVR